MAGVWRLRRRAIGAAAGLAALVATVGLASTGAEAAGGRLAKVYRPIDRGAGRAERAARSRPHARLHRVGDFDRPIDIAGAPGVKRTFYVVERPGRVIAVNGRHRHTFLSIASRTTTDGERGLLSIAFSPHFQRDHLVYAYYTNRGGNIEVDSFRASARHAHRSSRRKVIVIPHPGESNHNGGQLQFGPDGDLYFATGDGGGVGDQHHNAQDTHALLGKLLRIEPRRHGTRYRVPRSNPFVGRRGRDEIFALGLRNPFRFSFDGGRTAVGDVGQDSTEEIDYETHRSLRGANFGWNRFEGGHTFDRNTKLGGGHYERPIHTYPHGPGCAVIGGYVVRDPALASLRGRYVYTDLCTGALRSLVPHRKRGRGDRALGLHVSDPSSFGEAHHHLYVASLDGPVYRFVAKR
jgi:glucose/arabinose dehydrogenase